MATQILKQWTDEVGKIETWRQASDFEYKYKNDLKELKNVKEEDAPAVDELISACIANGNNKVMELAEKLVERRKLLDWKNHKPMIKKWLKQLVEYGKIPESENDELYSSSAFSTFTERLVTITKVTKIMHELGDDLFSIVEAALESEDNRLHTPAIQVIVELQWDQRPEWIIQVLERTYIVLKEYADLTRKDDLGCTITTSWMMIFQKLMQKMKEAEKYVSYVAKVFNYCKDQEWHDLEDSDRTTVAHELMKTTMEDYLNRHTSSATIIKPMLPTVKELWECGDEELQRDANYIITAISSEGHGLLEDDTADTLIAQYLSGEQPSLIAQFSQMYPKYPEKFNARVNEFVEAMQGQENWVMLTTLTLFWEIAKNSPESFSKDSIAAIVKTLPKEGTSAMGLMSLAPLSEKRREDVVIYDKEIIKCMHVNRNMAGQGGTILVQLSKVSEKKAKEYLKALKELIEKLDSMMAMGLLYNMRTIGTQYLEAITEYEEFFIKLKDDPALNEHAKGILDIIAGRTLEGISKDVEEQRDDIDNLDTRVTTTEENVSNMDKELDQTKGNVKILRKDVDNQGVRLTEVEEVVEETVEKVEEIDKKTLSHAPSWSKDVAKLMNPKSEHDWRLLASRLGYKNDDVRNWATQPDPCLSMLDEWFATHKTRDATFAILKSLQEMNRTDAAMIVENALKQVEDVVEDEEFEYTSPPPVFISYQWGLQQEVKMLKKHLEMCGFDSWMDIGQMGGGDKLFEKIDKGIRSAQIVICCVSEKYAASPNCNREVNLSVTLGKPIIPLLMEKMSWPPPGSMGPIFGEYLFIRFFARPGETANDDRYWPITKFQELLMQLRYYVAPDYSLVTNDLYKEWWSPPEEVIVITKKDKPADEKKNGDKKTEHNNTEKSPDVFISYQWGKQPQIKALFKKLSEQGYTCWLDIMQMGGGDSLYDKIDKGVRGCKVVLSCMTSKYSLSANCRREVSLADALKKPIIPLLLEKITWPPEGPMSMVFTQLLYINFCKPDIDVQNHWNCPQMGELLQKMNDTMSPSLGLDLKSNNSQVETKSVDPGIPSPKSIKNENGIEPKETNLNQNDSGNMSSPPKKKSSTCILL